MTTSTLEPSTRPDSHGDIIAGTIIGIVGLIMLVTCMKIFVLPWYKHYQELKVRRHQAVQNHGASYGSVAELAKQLSVPPILEVHSSSSLRQQLNVVPHGLQKTSAPTDNSQFGIKGTSNLSNEPSAMMSSDVGDQKITAEITGAKTCIKSDTTFDLNRRASLEFTARTVEVSRNSQSTVGSLGTVGTTLSMRSRYR